MNHECNGPNPEQAEAYDLLAKFYTMSAIVNCNLEVPQPGRYVLAWHRLHKCWITVRLVCGSNTASGNAEWLEKTLTTMWPLEAFSHWRSPPPSPTEPTGESE